MRLVELETGERDASLPNCGEGEASPPARLPDALCPTLTRSVAVLGPEFTPVESLDVGAPCGKREPLASLGDP